MALSPAERKRRSRRHNNGDHGACDPQRCGALGREATRAVAAAPGAATTAEPPSAADDSSPSVALGPRGRRLWDALRAGILPAQRPLLEEACRLADRLDRLADYLDGKTDVWLRLHARNEDGTVVEVVLDAALGEARQQALAFRQLMADLKGAAKPAAGGVTTRDRLAEQREKRLAESRAAAARVANSTGS